MYKPPVNINVIGLPILILMSYCISAFLFFHNPWFESLFLHLDSQDVSRHPYLEFSKHIFQRQYYENKEHWWVESLLFPLIAKLIGASRSVIAFKIFASFLTISLLPAVTFSYFWVSKNIYSSILLLIFLSLFYGGFYDYQVAFPDSLLAIFIGLSATQRRPSAIFLFIFLAGLTHFSIALFSSLGLAGIFIARSDQPTQSNYKRILAIFLGLIFSWLLLHFWLWLFHTPDHHGRFNWAINAGLTYFMERYHLDPNFFWLTPKLPLLLSTLALNLYFLINRRYQLVIASLFALAIAYVCLFFTVDGYRVFINIYCGPYIALIVAFIDRVCMPRSTTNI